MKEFDYFLSMPTHHNYQKWRDRLRQSCRTDIWEEAGCTRTVIITPDSNYVFKIQIDNHEDGIDYGDNEEYVYNKAVENHVERFFAWTANIGRFGATSVYAMEKVDVCADRISNESYSFHAECVHYEEDYEDEYCDPGDEYSSTYGMFQFAESVDGDEIWEAYNLLMSLNVNDCHPGNWGYRGNMLVLTDYAGYGRKLDR
jgi:hypothetical protein